MIVLFYGSKSLADRLEPQISNMGATMIAISGRIYNSDNLRSFDNLEGIDLAIVDSGKTGAEMVISYFWRSRKIPVALLVSGTHDDWDRLYCSEAVAYIPKVAGDQELAARIKSIVAGLMAT